MKETDILAAFRVFLVFLLLGQKVTIRFSTRPWVAVYANFTPTLLFTSKGNSDAPLLKEGDSLDQQTLRSI